MAVRGYGFVPRSTPRNGGPARAGRFPSPGAAYRNGHW